MLSWEDAYCNDKEKNDCSEINKWLSNADDNFKDEWYPQDHLGLAIANMSYRIYSIGEGVVGRVAATGKHQWISGIQLVNSLCSMDEHSDGWKTQVTAGIRFPAGCELYEALGPTFYKQKNCFDWETVTTETLTVDQMAGDTSSTQTSGSENLLEAVVASVCCSDSDTKWSKSSGQPVKPLSRLQPTPSDLQTASSICYSFERSLQGFSSASVSRCSEQLDAPREPPKAGKKRARPGESGKPRPRDRQLIQDRIKELRQLVPNGSKCSIDSLLERTIKHMLFMQCITKHADKIDKCAEFKLHGNKEQGSSWAMEVGNDLKVCPIIVENIGTEGQMLIEMVCDEGVNFLEITEAIRSLGLTILKGAIDAYGDKTWMCFIVEGENNRSIHRMDILWSLVQILELKTKT
ncbi:hypothetical protein M8C21_001417 [Ambrosia artemisiifolia]|uniref:BHLH domain-containing protein n=1 Tax=Ambrosia artemisiifolia TaxID=4212 RepID=A0AAD5BXA8_AMBAR|nr:hypothetical protein M8C21_001417 [Ambrosia artemisiifolia]